MVLPRTVAQRREDLEAAVGIRADESTTPLMLSDLAEKLRQEDRKTCRQSDSMKILSAKLNLSIIDLTLRPSLKACGTFYFNFNF